MGMKRIQEYLLWLWCWWCDAYVSCYKSDDSLLIANAWDFPTAWAVSSRKDSCIHLRCEQQIVGAVNETGGSDPVLYPPSLWIHQVTVPNTGRQAGNECHTKQPGMWELLMAFRDQDWSPQSQCDHIQWTDSVLCDFESVWLKTSTTQTKKLQSNFQYPQCKKICIFEKLHNSQDPAGVLRGPQFLCAHQTVQGLGPFQRLHSLAFQNKEWDTK